MSIQTLIEHGPFIGGTAEPLSGEQREITNPGTGELVGRVTDSTAQDADRAVAAAQAAFRDWARLGYADRGRIIHACAEAFEAHVDELTPILVAEQGKTIREAKIELHKAADTLEHYAGLSRQVRGISVHNVDPGVEARTLRRPLGVVAAIVPWNFPTTLLCNKLGPAFLTGNTVVGKPADTTPFTTLRLAEVFHEAGLPAGVFNVLPGAEDEAFCAVYGDWDPLTPTELRDLMAGYPEPWWVVGGWSVEAFTGVPRFHEDIDLVVYVEHVPQLREQLGGLFHLWSNAGGTFRLIDDRSPEPIEPLSQIWMREDARSPWRVDCILNGSVGGRWQSKRDASWVADLEEVTWVADDGVRYLRPEVSLLFKAKQHRVKDRIDLDGVWPLLDDERRAWLRESVRRLHPDHPWQARLDA